jgi:hypothetical protein
MYERFGLVKYPTRYSAWNGRLAGFLRRKCDCRPPAGSGHGHFNRECYLLHARELQGTSFGLPTSTATVSK